VNAALTRLLLGLIAMASMVLVLSLLFDAPAWALFGFGYLAWLDATNQGARA
jgi:hypothetical protein